MEKLKVSTSLGRMLGSTGEAIDTPGPSKPGWYGCVSVLGNAALVKAGDTPSTPKRYAVVSLKLVWVQVPEPAAGLIVLLAVFCAYLHCVARIKPGLSSGLRTCTSPLIRPQ